MIADCCLVYVADGGPLRLAAMAHADPAAMERLRELEPQLRLGEGAPYGPDHVFETAVSELVRLSDPVSDEPYHQVLRRLGFRSAIAVPVRVRGQTVGVILLAASRPLLAFVEDDVSMAEDLSRRTADAIDNARLYAAAQAAVKLRDEFLSIASHELRTPLTPLQLHLEMWQGALTNGDDARRRLDTALRQTQKLSKLVESLLDVSRLTTGRMALEPERFDLAQVAREVVERFAPDARSAGCAVTLLANEPVIGCWDRLRVEQVLSNLLSNAIKYGAGQPIDLTVERSGEEGACVRVTDRGIGITAEDSARIFDRFERAVSPRHYGGMGLGLYIVRQIVEAHAGSIAVESTPGAGSSFTVLLPSLHERSAGLEAELS
jgi:signal transduction histidine kinase